MSDYGIGSEVWPGLGKLAEECGETLQVIGKIIGLGTNNPATFYNHWDGTDVRERLEEEMADVLAAIRFVSYHNNLDFGAIERRSVDKRMLFEEWHRGLPADSSQ